MEAQENQVEDAAVTDRLVKKRYVIISLLAASLSGYGQRLPERTYEKKRLSTTDVQTLLSYYTQDNDHSAVTGGKGTEDLQVYASSISFDWKKDSVRTVHFDAGVDIISSASTDNIDFEVSSASKLDARSHGTLGYSRYLPKGFTAGINGTFSIESDYLSKGLGLNFGHINEDQSREITISLETFFDDLRWGRFDRSDDPLQLIYPDELRYKEWFDDYKRRSFNLEAGIFQTINRRTSIGIYTGLMIQAGVLATPFHRVYFTDDSERVENLPDSRIKIPVSIQLNTFIGSRCILRSNYRFYKDDFGIRANTLSAELAVKINAVFTITSIVRFYTQTASDYFKPYAEHDPSKEFYTSDYDLSKFTSIKPGLALRYAPYSGKRRSTFNEIDIRYSYYKRSDGLHAGMITLLVNYTKKAK